MWAEWTGRKWGMTVNVYRVSFGVTKCFKIDCGNVFTTLKTLKIIEYMQIATQFYLKMYRHINMYMHTNVYTHTRRKK